MFLVFISLLPLVGLNIYFIQRERMNEENLINQRAFELSKLTASTQEKYIESTKQLLIAFSQLPEILDPKSKNCNEILAQLLTQYPAYSNFGVLDTNANLICSAVIPSSQVNLSDRPFFRKALDTKDFSVGEYFVGRVTGKEVINFGYPVKTSNGVVLRIVYASMDLSWLSDLIAKQHFSNEDTIFVLDRKGKILAKSPDREDSVGKSINNKGLLKTLITNSEGVTEDKGEDDKDYLFAFSSLVGSSDSNIVLVIQLPKEPLLQQVEGSFRLDLIWLAGATLICLLTLTLIAKPTYA